MEITIKVWEEKAEGLHNRSVLTDELKELIALEDEFDVMIRPLHPYSDDAHLDPYFSVDMPMIGSADVMLYKLQDCKMVEAAYIKPSDEMP